MSAIAAKLLNHQQQVTGKVPGLFLSYASKLLQDHPGYFQALPEETLNSVCARFQPVFEEYAPKVLKQEGSVYNVLNLDQTEVVNKAMSHGLNVDNNLDLVIREQYAILINSQEQRSGVLGAIANEYFYKMNNFEESLRVVKLMPDGELMILIIRCYVEKCLAEGRLEDAEKAANELPDEELQQRYSPLHDVADAYRRAARLGDAQRVDNAVEQIRRRYTALTTNRLKKIDCKRVSEAIAIGALTYVACNYLMNYFNLI